MLSGRRWQDEDEAAGIPKARQVGICMYFCLYGGEYRGGQTALRPDREEALQIDGKETCVYNSGI